MGSKSGQPQQQQKSGYSGGKSGQSQNRNPGFQMGGKQNKSGWQPQSPNYGKSGQMQPMQQQGGNRWNQGYANLTGNPNPSMPPQIGAPQTGAFPYPQQPQAQPQQDQTQQPAQTPTPPAQAFGGFTPGRYPGDFSKVTPDQIQAYMSSGGPGLRVEPNTKNRFQASKDFFNAVEQTLGPKQMALRGEYDKGWNALPGGMSMAQAKKDAAVMEKAIGRPLTLNEVQQLGQRAAGWHFNPPEIDFATGKPHGPALKPEDYWKPMSQEDQQAQFGLAAPKKSYP